MTWPEAKRAIARRPVLVPIGSTEQHGHHMPLGTDHFIAERLAHAAAERTSCVVAPTLPYGISSEHRQFPGTVWVSFEAFRAFLGDVCRSMARHGAGKIILVNGHGGQVFAAQYLARELRDEGIYLGIHEWWEGLTPEFDKKTFGAAARHWGHACAKETALGLTLFPDAVKMSRARDLPTNWGPRLRGGVKTLDCADFAPTGGIGYPTAATRRMGEKTFDFAVENLSVYIRHVRRTPLRRLLAARIH